MLDPGGLALKNDFQVIADAVRLLQEVGGKTTAWSAHGDCTQDEAGGGVTSTAGLMSASDVALANVPCHTLMPNACIFSGVELSNSPIAFAKRSVESLLGASPPEPKLSTNCFIPEALTARTWKTPQHTATSTSE